MAEGDKDADRERVEHAVAEELPQKVAQAVVEPEPVTETVPETVSDPELEPDDDTEVESDTDEEADCDALRLRATLGELEGLALADCEEATDGVTVVE